MTPVIVYKSFFTAIKRTQLSFALFSRISFSLSYNMLSALLARERKGISVGGNKRTCQPTISTVGGNKRTCEPTIDIEPKKRQCERITAQLTQGKMQIHHFLHEMEFATVFLSLPLRGCVKPVPCMDRVATPAPVCSRRGAAAHATTWPAQVVPPCQAVARGPGSAGGLPRAPKPPA